MNLDMLTDSGAQSNSWDERLGVQNDEDVSES